ncbi:unnamed protein product [Bursaphelenchus okinawaensis]|uniref:Suppressor APC domain-containing protein n=1 Tax=Bursaphelenchus okinawaensis TaxID=465554 RepID=A0A811LRM7_9BILA|nr:unnamed protein product [Bursaphelenchus okinawaensis]CAG9127199.1 unnamed protein product [Bursaphelenchus okinawaensis]
MRSRQQNTAALPPHFVDSLQRLFTLLDSQCGNRGKVPLELIASQWQNLQHQFPAGFLECLGRVAPPDGLLNFERFLAGFRLVIASRQKNVRLKRVRSEGKLDEIGPTARHPAMGINGLLVEQNRPYSASSNARALKAQYGSQPSLNTKYIQPPAPILRLPESRDYSSSNYDYVKSEPFRRPASAGAGVLVRAGTETNTTTSDSSPSESNNYSVVMRSRSKGPPVASTKQMRAPAPPQSKSIHNLHQILNGNRYRPASLTSSGSGSCSGSSGMAEVRWNNSRQSSSNSPPDSIRQYSEDHLPQVY